MLTHGDEIVETKTTTRAAAQGKTQGKTKAPKSKGACPLVCAYTHHTMPLCRSSSCAHSFVYVAK